MTDEVVVAAGGDPVIPSRKHSLMKKASYRCACGNVVVCENYMPDEAPLPALGCGKCKKGQGMDMAAQVYNRVGLLLHGEVSLYSLDHQGVTE